MVMLRNEATTKSWRLVSEVRTGSTTAARVDFLLSAGPAECPVRYVLKFAVRDETLCRRLLVAEKLQQVRDREVRNVAADDADAMRYAVIVAKQTPTALDVIAGPFKRSELDGVFHELQAASDDSVFASKGFVDCTSDAWKSGWGTCLAP